LMIASTAYPQIRLASAEIWVRVLSRAVMLVTPT